MRFFLIPHSFKKKKREKKERKKKGFCFSISPANMRYFIKAISKGRICNIFLGLFLRNLLKSNYFYCFNRFNNRFDVNYKLKITK